ncbi:type I polyketide synthase [Actinophytocola sp.]|uniref:type I polyketide synthase n=1 Tax=Actinophytocola sp. TaxID=1872138 RepID=UPI002ED7E247
MADNAEKLREYLKKALAELQTSRARVRELEEAAHEPIAVVGIGCRYPGGIASADDLWEVVRSGTDAVSALPADRDWFPTGDQETTPVGVLHQREGGFLYDAGDFDAGFFGMTEESAVATDPQQRLLLETAWEAVENGGIDPLSLRGSRTGVYIGAFYRLYAVAAQTGDEPNHNLVAGVTGAMMAGRIAYELGLEGPSATVDTACSASLVALHLACQSLRLGESELALAGGVAVNATPHVHTEFMRPVGLAPDGRCRSFSASANGSGWSEGVGVLLLERLSSARANGHRILGLVRGSATNRAGAANGLTAPSGQTQQRTVRHALADAGLHLDDVDVIEAHGSGTRLGDSIEAHAMLATYGSTRRPGDPLLLGSIKSNIGHTQSSSGIAGVIKMIQAMRHAEVPRTLHVDEPSPDIDWSTGRIGLVTEALPWPDRGHPRRSAVSSVGISGTNVHVILEQAPEPPPTEAGNRALATIPWPVSAKTETALAAQAARLLAHVTEHPDLDPADVGYTLATARASFEHRAVVLGGDRAELLAGLSALASDTAADTAAATVLTGRARAEHELAFSFPAAPEDPFPAGPALYRAFPGYAEAFDQAAAEADKHLTTSLLDVVAGTTRPDPADRPAAELWHLAHQVALSRLLYACGLRPDVVTGTGTGEVAAAHAAGILTLTDATLLVAARSGAADLATDLATAAREITFATPATTMIPGLDAPGGTTPADPAATRAALRARDVTLLVELTEATRTDDDLPTLTPPSTPDGVLAALAQAHCRGLTVTWAPLFDGTGASQVQLPTYAFQRTRYWWQY